MFELFLETRKILQLDLSIAPNLCFYEESSNRLGLRYLKRN